MTLVGLLQRYIRTGTLTLIDARGNVHRFEGGPGPSATIRISDPKTEWKLVSGPDPGLGEAYMDGSLVIEEGDLFELMDLCAINFGGESRHPLGRFGSLAGYVLRRLHQYNPASRARQNIAHHYDLTGELYQLFLDADRQYSCAYFARPDLDLEAAQLAKKRHIANKLLLQPGQRVLDIGSGWGGLGLFLAQEHGVSVTGLTLSTEQQRASSERAARARLGDRVWFLLQDYRAMTGQFDRIVSVGMFEHVGVNHFGEYFGKVSELLKPDGVALLHSIGRMQGPSSTSPFIRKYIFPGGYIPALSEVLPFIEKKRLWVTDVEILRLHYAETLLRWRQRFMANRDRVLGLFDERFIRMWEYYLVASELFFRRLDGMVFQVQLAKDRHAVPLTRDYIYAGERRDEAMSAAA